MAIHTSRYFSIKETASAGHRRQRPIWAAAVQTPERLNENVHNVNEFLDGTHRLHTMIEELKQQDRLQRLIQLTN